MKRNNSLWKWTAAYFVAAGALLVANPNCAMELEGRLPGEKKYKLEERIAPDFSLEKVKSKDKEFGVLPPTGCKEYVDILVDLNQKICDERETLTEQDLPHLLASSKIGDTKINQYLRLGNREYTSEDAKSQTVTNNGKDNLFFIKEDNTILRYELEFERGFVSAVDSEGNLTDLVGQQINILGHKYTIATAAKRSPFDIELTFVSEDFKIRWVNKASDLAIVIDGTNSFISTEHNEQPIEDANALVLGQKLKDGKTEIQRVYCWFQANGSLSIHRGESLRQKLDKNSLPGLKLDITYAGQTENKKHVVRVYEKE